MKSKYLFIAIFSVIGLFSCINEGITFEDNNAFKGEKWLREDKVSFDFEVKDTSRSYLLSAYVRNYNDYDYCNLYINYELQDSTKKVMQSALKDLILYNPKTGEPLGEVELFSNAQTGVYLLDSVRFSQLGKHTISLQHQMRNAEKLDKIQSIGVQVQLVD